MPAPTQIPVQTLPTNAGTSTGQLLLLLLYLVLILVGVYYATRWFAKVAQRGTIFTGRTKHTFQPGRHLLLVDRLAFDKDKSVILIKAEQKFYLLGVSSENISLISELAPEEVDYTAEAERAAGTGQASFKDVFAAWKQGKQQ